MVEILIPFGLQKLWDSLSQGYEHFQGASEHELKTDLKQLISFVNDEDARKHTDESLRNCVQEAKDIIYDAEDIMETFSLKEKLGKKNGIKKRIGRIACIIPYRIEFASDIRGISKRISKVIPRMKSTEVQRNIADHLGRSLYPQLPHNRQRESRTEFAMDSKMKPVGIEEDVEKLVGHLVEEDNVQVVFITGMGGIGKTTLARQAFHHEKVTKKFDRRAWVCVSHDFDRENVWQRILENLRPDEEKNKIRTMEALQSELRGLLETSKSLIVIDDIWNEADWGRIKPIFPFGEGDWKVLLTSRIDSVLVSEDETYTNIKPKGLSEEDSWTLLQRLAFSRKDPFGMKNDPKMKEMAEQMAIRCKGLPLTVKVLGGMLAANYTPQYWERAHKNTGAHITKPRNSDETSATVDILSLSFEELPTDLKQCFLYLAHFPEDHKIDVENLSYHLAAEGIIKLEDDKPMTIRDVGDDYIKELVMRNIVIAERDITTSRFETCQLHDVMREICLLKAKEEKFLQIGVCSSTAHSQYHGISRRFVSQKHKASDVRDINNPKLRSLVVICDEKEKGWMMSSINFKKLQLLRKLDLSGAEFEGEKLSSSIGKLIHLRYLSLERAKVSHLPSSLRNLMSLIYLNICVSPRPILVPNIFKKMQDLRYLALPWHMDKKTKLELSNLVKLETLKNFSTGNSSLEDLSGMAELRNLHIVLHVETSLETLSASIGRLEHLENLEIDEARCSKRRITEAIVLNIAYLKQLQLKIFMSGLPDIKHWPSSLTRLILLECHLEEDPMPILEKLRFLKEVRLRERSFRGTEMVCSADGFPQLQKLALCGLHAWEKWIVKEGSMPLLHTLEITDCKKLQELSDGLQFITSLKDLRVEKEWEERLSENGQDYDKVKHIPSVVFTSC